MACNFRKLTSGQNGPSTAQDSVFEHISLLTSDTCLFTLKGMIKSFRHRGELLGVTRQALNNLVNEKAGISAEMAIRLEKIGWSTADHWMRVQAAYELAQARHTQDQIKVEHYEPHHA